MLMNFRFLSSGILSLMLFFPALSFGQICMPDTSFTDPGFYPDSLPPACVNIPYSTTLTVVVPQDTTVALPPFGTFTLPIDSVVLDDIIGLPASFSYGCNPGNCVIPGASTGCVGISGTSSAADTIDLEVALTFYVVSPIGPLTLSDTAQGLFTLYINPGFTTTLVTNDAACGSSDGTAKISASGGSGSFTYAWSNGATTDSIGGLSAGLYTVVTTDTSGCTKTDTVIINTNGSNPVLSVDSTYWAGCALTGGGVIAVSSTGGDGNYSYSWSNGATADSLGGLQGGIYSVIVTDGLGCSDFESISVTQPGELTLTTVNEENLNCFGDDSGLIEISATGGVGMYTYSWSNLPNEAGVIVNSLPAGTYDVVVEDEAGCQKTLSFMLTEPDSIDIALTILGETAFGQGDGRASADVSGGTLPYIYSWDNGATADSIVDVAPGLYVLTVTDANGCEKSVDVEIPSVAQSMEDALQIRSFSVAPNPTIGEITITWDLGSAAQEAYIRLLDLRGAEVKTWGSVSGSGSIQDHISLPAGVYLLALETESGAGYKKIVIR